MHVLIWVIAIVGVYFFLLFVAARLVVPFMGFGKFAQPPGLPPEIRSMVTELENQSSSQVSYLQAVYNVVLDKTLHQWKHTRFKAALRLPRAFVKDLNEIWRTNDFLYCTQINYAIFAMLINSKFFSEKDIKVRHVFINFFIHQYLQVKVGEKWIDVDPAGAGIRGFGIGHHASILG